MEGQVPEVERRIEALYGTAVLPARGLLHVVAAVRTSAGFRVLRIGPQAPRSSTDFFILNLCRARADAILTTAENLRAEPALHHDLQGDHADALRAYRVGRLGKRAAPVSAILTRSGNLPLEHALWADGTSKLVLSATTPSPPLVHALAGRARFVHLPGLDARAACAWLAAQGHGLVSVEAGPSTASTLYGEGSPVTELALSLYEGALQGVALGGALPSDLTNRLTRSAEVARQEESGAWRFSRWVAP